MRTLALGIMIGAVAMTLVLSSIAFAQYVKTYGSDKPALCQAK